MGNFRPVQLMKKHKAKSLISKYVRDAATREERTLLEQWFQKDLENSDYTPSRERIAEADQRITAFLISHLGVQHSKTKVIRLWPRIAAAASVILALSFGGYFLLKKQQSQQISYYKNDISPGHNQATLTLANGQKIVLTKGLSGKLAQQGNTLIGVNRQKAIAYIATGGNANLPATFNTLSTAVGEQSPYPLVLTDGTKVWLNAESSITFPTAFDQKDRIVKITGEALFEVAHNANKPFKVLTDKQTIEDIGTQFDVNAYSDEPNSGKAKPPCFERRAVARVINNGSQAVVLKPGEQSVLTGNNLKIEQANILKAVAWKNSEFRFSDDNIETIMRQLARWYNIDVSYEGAVTKEVFYAKLSRQRDISTVLRVLERTKGIHFKVEGRRVTVIQ